MGQEAAILCSGLIQHESFWPPTYSAKLHPRGKTYIKTSRRPHIALKSLEDSHGHEAAAKRRGRQHRTLGAVQEKQREPKELKLSTGIGQAKAKRKNKKRKNTNGAD